MIVTDNDEWAKRAKHLTTQAKDDPIEYVHSEIGFNYRLTNVQAAMGVAQLEMLSSYVEINGASRRLIPTSSKRYPGSDHARGRMGAKRVLDVYDRG